MNLRALLKPVGAVLASGVIVLLFVRRDDATAPELRDAGVLACPEVDVACEVRVSESQLDKLEARGVTTGRRYRRVVLDARDCRAGGLGLILTDRRLYSGDGGFAEIVEVIDGRCTVVGDDEADDGGAGLKELPLECGCRKASGVCRYQLPDGGQVTAPQGRTLGPGYPPFETFGGAGCERKACIEFFGDSSWPESCPGG